MAIPRKPTQDNKAVEHFIKKASSKSLYHADSPLASKRGYRVVSISLMEREAAWIDDTLRALNPQTSRRITRTEIITAALGLLRSKTPDDVLQILRNR